jgi:hypothetical protein
MLVVVAAASLAAVGVASAQDPRVGPDGDADSDGVVNAQGGCPEASDKQTSPVVGKLGCPAFRWDGGADTGRLGDVVDDGYVTLNSRCQPGICTTTFTLSAGKQTRAKLGLEKALIGRKTIRQRARGGFPENAAAEFDLPRAVVRKMDGLDKVELKAKFEVSGPDSARMQAVEFTESGTLKMDRRRPRGNSDPRGQGLRLVRGTCKTATYDLCEEVNAN